MLQLSRLDVLMRSAVAAHATDATLAKLTEPDIKPEKPPY
jgi:hypothetical protein